MEDDIIPNIINNSKIARVVKRWSDGITRYLETGQLNRRYTISVIHKADKW